MPKWNTSLYERVMERAEWHENGCLLVSSPLQQSGYVQLRTKGKQYKGHIIVWEHEVGTIPEGMTLDHMCHNADLSCSGGPKCLHRRCVNVKHLEPVLPAVNTSRANRRDQSKCGKGIHDWVEENIGESRKADGRIMRYCRPCQHATKRAKKKAGI